MGKLTSMSQVTRRPADPDQGLQITLCTQQGHVRKVRNIGRNGRAGRRQLLLVSGHLMSKIPSPLDVQVEDIPLIDELRAGEEGRRILREVRQRRDSQGALIDERMRMGGFPVLELLETNLINQYLGPALGAINTLQKIQDRFSPSSFRLFTPTGPLEWALRLDLWSGLRLEPRVRQFEDDLPPFPIARSSWGRLAQRLIRLSPLFPALHSTTTRILEGPNGGVRISTPRGVGRHTLAIISVNPKQSDTVVELASSAHRFPNLDVLILHTDSRTKAYLISRGIPSRSLYGENILATETKALRIWNSLRREWNRLSKDADLFEGLDYHGVRLSRPLHQIFRCVMRRDLYYASREFCAMERVVKRLEPSALLVTNEREASGKSWVASARKHGLHTFACQRGVIADHPEVGPISVDRMFVNGDFYKEILVKRGVEETEIEVTGNPRFDPFRDLMAQTDLVRRTVFRDLGIHENRALVLVISQPTFIGFPPAEKSRFLDIAVSGGLGVADCVVALKLHPTQEAPEIERRIVAARGDGDRVFILRDEVPLPKLLIAADAAIIYHSTVGLDAGAVGTPLIQIAPEAETVGLLPFDPAGFVTIATDVDTVEGLLRDVISHSRARSSRHRGNEQFRSRNLYRIDGKSGHRVLSSILRTLEGQGHRETTWTNEQMTHLNLESFPSSPSSGD